MGLYLLFVSAKNNIKLLFKQVSFYFLVSIIIAMIIMVNPYVAGTASMIMHIVAIIAGVVFAMIYRKTIKAFFRDYNEYTDR